MKITIIIARSILALVYLVFGLNFFLHFIPMTPPTGKAAAFSGGLMGSGYFFQFMKVIEITSGLFLLIDKFTPFFLVLLFPVTVNIFLFHTFLEPSGVPMAGAMLLIHIFLGFAYGRYYRQLFIARPVIE